MVNVVYQSATYIIKSTGGTMFWRSNCCGELPPLAITGPKSQNQSVQLFPLVIPGSSGCRIESTLIMILSLSAHTPACVFHQSSRSTLELFLLKCHDITRIPYTIYTIYLHAIMSVTGQVIFDFGLVNSAKNPCVNTLIYWKWFQETSSVSHTQTFLAQTDEMIGMVDNICLTHIFAFLHPWMQCYRKSVC